MSAKALRLDDVGAASKQHEVYGLTRIPVGPWAMPFPGNFLFLKYVRPIKRWGPYRELTEGEWERMLEALQAASARMSVAITAGWVERDGRVVPFPRKFPGPAGVIREGVRRGLLEVANHGYTHCVLQERLFRPRLFSGNRPYHREFHDWLPESVHREHLARAQGILQDFFAVSVVTLVPPGSVFSRKTVLAAQNLGIRYVSCRDAARWGEVDGVTFVAEDDTVAIHDRDVVLGGPDWFPRLLRGDRHGAFVAVRDLAERLAPRSA